MFVKAVGYVKPCIFKGACEEPLGERKQLPLTLQSGAGAVCLTGCYKLILSNNFYFIISCLLTSVNIITKFTQAIATNHNYYLHQCSMNNA